MLGLYTAYLNLLLVPKKRQFTDTQLFALIKKYMDIYMDSVLYQSMHDLSYYKFIIITSNLSEIDC